MRNLTLSPNGQPGSYQLAGRVSTDKRASRQCLKIQQPRCVLSYFIDISHFNFISLTWIIHDFAGEKRKGALKD
jgi:hypothetical protein